VDTWRTTRRERGCFFRHAFVPFPVEITTSEGKAVETTALELVAMRVRSFGGPLRHWKPGSSLLSDDLRLVLLRNSNRAHMLRYTLQALTGLAPFDGLEKEMPTVVCFGKIGACRVPEVRAAQLRVQADGELLGPAPTRIEIVPDALTLLIPPEAGWIGGPLTTQSVSL